MELGGGAVHRGVIRPALASTDRKFLLKLLQLELERNQSNSANGKSVRGGFFLRKKPLEGCAFGYIHSDSAVAAHPPQAAVLSLTLSAEAGQSSKVQLGLFAPQMPEPSRLDVTIARLKAIAGEDRVGSPVLEDTHRPGSFRMEGFAVTANSGGAKAASPRMALRRMRPPMPVSVAMNTGKPIRFRGAEQSFEVTAAYGPWRTSGCWWATDEWDCEEWDVLATTQRGVSAACLLVHDNSHNSWQVAAFYD
jgi:protein ImuB